MHATFVLFCPTPLKYTVYKLVSMSTSLLNKHNHPTLSPTAGTHLVSITCITVFTMSVCPRLVCSNFPDVVYTRMILSSVATNIWPPVMSVKGVSSSSTDTTTNNDDNESSNSETAATTMTRAATPAALSKATAIHCVSPVFSAVTIPSHRINNRGCPEGPQILTVVSSDPLYKKIK